MSTQTLNSAGARPDVATSGTPSGGLWISAVDGADPWVGTAEIEVSLDGETWSTSSVSPLAADEYKTIPELAVAVRLNVTAYTSGELVCTLVKRGAFTSRGAVVSDPLAAFSTAFTGETTISGAGFTLEDSSPSASPTDTVTAGVADVGVAEGSATGSFWFDTDDGILWYIAITGACDMRARVNVTNATDTGLPPTTGFRIAGIAAHDPNRAAYNYVHVGLGSNDAAPLKREWKTTDDSDSAYAYTDATLTGGELLYDLRIVRRASDLQIFDLYVRAGTAAPLRSDVGWELVQTIDRTDVNTPDRVANGGSTAVAMPDTLRWGLMVYSNLAAHDIRMFVDEVVFSTPA